MPCLHDFTKTCSPYNRDIRCILYVFELFYLEKIENQRIHRGYVSEGMPYLIHSYIRSIRAYILIGLMAIDPSAALALSYVPNHASWNYVQVGDYFLPKQ